MNDINKISLNLNNDLNENNNDSFNSNEIINPFKAANHISSINEFDLIQNQHVDQNGFYSNLEEFENSQIGSQINIKVFGLGGAGNNIISHISQFKIIDAKSLFAINTDYQFLKKLPPNFNKMLIGKYITKGRGSGSNPIIGKESALEDIDEIKKKLEGTDLLFIVSGMGKGTGTGASPVVAKIAKELGILTLCIVNIPSIKTEGKAVYEKGIIGLNELKKYADGISIINNEKIINNNIRLNQEEISLKKSFEIANDLIANIINEIVDTINTPYDINVDFNDIKNFFSNQVEFQLDTFKLNQNDNIEEIIKNQISRQIYNREIKNLDRILINFKVNSSVPQHIIANIRQAYENILDNNEFPLTYCLSYDDNIDFANVSILIASKLTDYEQNVNYQINETIELVDDQHNSFKKIEIKTTELNNSYCEPPISNHHTNAEMNNLMNEFKKIQKDFEQLGTSNNKEENDYHNVINHNEQLDYKQDTFFTSTKLNNFFSRTLSLYQKDKNQNKNE